MATSKQVILYARVSREEQAKDDAVSIDEQWADMRVLCERSGWHIVAEYVDCEDYRATQNPKKGAIVNPSGERIDRPQFLLLLEHVKTGEVDAVLCWRDDRLVRHPRVAVVLEDALDVGDRNRKSNTKTQVLDATGAVIDRFTLHIKAAIWREENKRRTERMRMGKIGTLKEGRWPGQYDKFGYATVKEAGKRGCIITLGSDAEVKMIKDIFDWYDRGIMVRGIRKKLIAQTAKQRHLDQLKYDWTPSIINRILRDKDYIGKATWRFTDGVEYTIDIPQIIPLELWERVQKKIDGNKQFSRRRTKGIFMCQGLVRCGECDRRIGINLLKYRYRRMADGSKKRYDIEVPVHQYRCSAGQQYPDSHPRPYTWEGNSFDWAVWRKIVDYGIKNPQLIQEQVEARQAELQRQGDSTGGDIVRAKQNITDVDNQRAIYQRQLSRGKITEEEFDARMAETEDALQHWKEEVRRLTELRDDRAKIQSGLDYARELLEAIQRDLPKIDQPLEELRQLPKEQRLEILAKRQKIVRALCDKITVWSNGRVKIEGLLDGSEGVQFGLQGTCLL